MLELDAVGAGYGSIQILFDVSLSVGAGEALAVIGPNGAGKTTLLRTISGFLTPTDGRIRFEDAEISGLRPHQVVDRGIAQVLEGRRIIGGMTVLDNLLLGAHVRLGRARSDVERSIERVWELFPVLADRSALAAGSLSGGEQQMLAISRALMSRPKLMLLDEPSMGLAPYLVDQIRDTLLSLKRSEGLTMILVEQNPDLAAEVADRVCVMETGQIVTEGATELLDDRERVARLYLGGEGE